MVGAFAQVTQKAESDLLDCEAGLSDHFGRAPRSKKANIMLDEAFGQVKQSRLVIHRNNGC
jgi:hypothetical protein